MQQRAATRLVSLIRNRRAGRYARNYATAISNPDARLIRESLDSIHSFTSRSTSAPTGRFGYPSLQSPSDFKRLAEQTIRRANAIVDRLIAFDPTSSETQSSSSSPALSSFDAQERALLIQVKQIDRLSDLLCGLIDVAEVVRSMDPDPHWVAAADQAHSHMCYYMNTLNTHVQLYIALKRVHDPVANGSATSASTSSHKQSTLFPALVVSAQFLADFEKSGIHLPDSQRKQFVDLSDEILTLGRDFTNPHNQHNTTHVISIDREEVEKVSRSIASRLRGWAKTPWSNQIMIDPTSPEAVYLRSNSHSSTVREALYRASIASDAPPIQHRVELLNTLLQKRYDLAQLTGRHSFAQVTLADKMASNPENVKAFLSGLVQQNRPQALAELEYLKQARSSRHGAIGHDQAVQPWDRDYLIQRASQTRFPSAPPQSSISPFFSVGTCIAGLSALFQRLYGVHFVLESLAPGEMWCPNEVRKLCVYDEREGKIGIIYIDLFAREGKPNGAAHFTVRCARRTDDDNAEVDAQFAKTEDGHDLTNPAFPILENGKDVRTTYRGRDGEHQLPAVLLTCEFDKPDASKPGLLAWQEVQTLFHEMGHAMHSMLGRTAYHNVAGTRCATDLVELPSILMEHFLSSPDVLKLFAVHHCTGVSMPLDLWQPMEAATRGFSALETNLQIVLATADQACHSAPESTSHAGFDSTTLWQNAHDGIAVIPPASGTAWQANFHHLVCYGASYYSYLFDRAIANRVWQSLFANNPLSRDAGERYKDQLLRHGGGRQPWEAVSAVLDQDLRGDHRAMKEVGSWGVQ